MTHLQYRTDMSCAARGLYAIMCSAANGSNTLIITNENLAEMCGVTPETARKYLKKLQESGFIASKPLDKYRHHHTFK